MGDIKQNYQVMFDNMAQGAFYQLQDGSLTDVNEAALSMFGVSRNEFLGRTSYNGEWRVITEDGKELPPERHPSMVALRTGQPVRNFVAGVYNRQRHGATWMQINAIPMFREGEAYPYQVFVTLHDISEQKRTSDIHLSRIHLMQFAHSHTLEEFLVEALDELERLTGSALGFYHFYDEDTRCITLKEWSTRTAELFCRMKDKGGHYGIDHAGVWVDCIHQGKPVIHNDYASLPHRRGLPEGHARVVNELVVPLRRNRRTVAILGIGNKPVDYTEADVQTVSLFADLTWDITEQKRADEAIHAIMRASRENNILTNTAMDGYSVMAEGRLISVNGTMCRMLGFSMEEMLGKTIGEIDVDEDRATIRARIALIKERGYDRFETRYRRKDGVAINVEVNAAYLPESDAIVAFSRDITERKQVQQELLNNRNELRLANELLEHRVAQRTADLQAAIREQESFSYSVSHDLRAPLRHINSYSGLLLEDYADLLPEEARGYLDRIMAASSRMGTLIDHLLELSRVTRTELQLGRVDLSEIAAATLRMLGETDPHRLVEQKIEPTAEVLGDYHLLSQLLGNLLENAWKYTSRTSPAVIAFGTALVDDGEEAFYVRDNGAGFDMAYQENLFKAFERLHGSEFEGVGIGLATAQRIIQRHGGKIWGHGAVGEGATFYFTLPVYF